MEEQENTKYVPVYMYYGKGFIVLLCCLCAVIGGVTGCIAALVFSGRNRTEIPLVTEETATIAVTSTIPEIILTEPDTLPEPTTEASTVPPTTLPETTRPPENTTVSKTAKDVYNENVSSVVGISCKMKSTSVGFFATTYEIPVSGSGFIISADGYIVTNYHVVENAYDFRVTLDNNAEFPAELRGFYEAEDVAVLKINADGLKPVTTGKSADLSVGEEILIIGNPLGELTNTLTRGVVSATGRRIDHGNGYVLTMFQTDAAVNEGNSGGPVFDSEGNVVGIAAAKYASESIEGLSFCIPIEDVLMPVSEIIEYGYVRGEPLIGLSAQSVTATMAARYGLVEGCYVVSVNENSPASACGIAPRDVITAVNASLTRTTDDLYDVLEACSSGDTVTLTVYRSGTYSQIPVSLGEKRNFTRVSQYSGVYNF